MRALLVLLAGLVLLTGCTNKEDMAMYYRSIEMTAKAQQQANMSEDIAYIQAITALKDNPMAIMALALTKDKGDAVIDYSGIYHPQGFVEGVKAVTPIVTTGIAWGLGAWGVSRLVDGMGGSTYNVSGESDVSVDSTLTNSQTDGLSWDNVEVDGEINIRPSGSALQDCLEDPPGGVSEEGNPLYSPGLSCTTFFQ